MDRSTESGSGSGRVRLGACFAYSHALSSEKGHMAFRSQFLGLIAGVILGWLSVGISSAAVANGTLTVDIARRDLRPLPAVTVQLAGAANLQGVTENSGRATFAGLPAAGGLTITPARSGFRFEPAQFHLPNLGNAAEAAFTVSPAATDLSLTMTVDTETPKVGGMVNQVITVRNMGAEAATDVVIGFNSLPGLVVEERQATAGQLSERTYDTAWRFSQLDPGAVAEVRVRSRAVLPDANVLLVAILEEMDQTDLDPGSNSALMTVRPRPAQARLGMTLAINPATAKVGEAVPVRVTLRNDGPDDATQITLRSYLPPGVFLFDVPGLSGLLPTTVIPRLAAGSEIQLGAMLSVHFTGTFTLIANVSYCEEPPPAGVAWPEARVEYSVQPAFSQITLFAFTDPPNPRVGEEVNVVYVAKNEGPDTVTSLNLFMRADPGLGSPRTLVQNHPLPPLPGPFVTGDVVPPGAYTYSVFRYSVNKAGDLVNYFAVESQDQAIPNAGDHPILQVPIHAMPSDITLSLAANPREMTVRSGDPVTLEFPVHNDGPHAATGVLLRFSPEGLSPTGADEVIHADRVERPSLAGFIDVLQPGETVRVRKQFIAACAGTYENAATLHPPFERPDLLSPVATELIRLQVLPLPPPDLRITVNVDSPQVNVGETALFTVTVLNRGAQPALSVVVRETEAADTGFAFETVRSYGPHGDDRISSGSYRIIPRIEPGGRYVMSRTMRFRKAVTIPYYAKVTGVGCLSEAEIPAWVATTQVTGVQVTSDIAAGLVPDRTQVKNGDLVNFAVVAYNGSGRLASHAGFSGGISAGFQMLGADLGSYGFYYESQRPRDLESSTSAWTDWTEIRPGEGVIAYLSAYAVSAGPLSAAVRLSQLDQIDALPANNLATAQLTASPASTRVTLRQTLRGDTAHVGDNIVFVTEIRNEGPDRVTGLRIEETVSSELELNTTPAVNGLSGPFVVWPFDSVLRLPALDPGQTFILQRTYFVRSTGNGFHRVRVVGFDQTSLAPLADDQAAVALLPAQADVRLEFIDRPAVAQADIPTLVSVRVRNHGPSVATSIRVGFTLPADRLRLGVFGLGPRASHDFLAPNAFHANLLPGESATASVYLTPLQAGPATAVIQVQRLDQVDPELANNILSLSIDVGPAPPLRPILRVRRVRTDFFDRRFIAEVEIDQAELGRMAPGSLFRLEGSSNLRDWEDLGLVGLFPLAPVTFTDHARPGDAARVFRLRP